VFNFLKLKAMTEIIYKEESYEIIGICMEVHNYLGKGFSEIVYKDALEYEFKKAGIPYSREKEFAVQYKDVILPHKFFADFTLYNKILLEAKAIKELTDEHLGLTMNYLCVADYRLGLLVNFWEKSLIYKRVVL
jgi:GxxExxY protein